ncbi:MAG: hypothetical protein LJE67_16375 [Salaquimonas sp.]|nr:hypothetical protein [Salaquimonas sp.]
MNDSDDRTQSIRDIATALPFLAVVLLTSPLIVAFSSPVNIFGVPMIVAYLFSVWIAVIVIAFVVARRLERAEHAEAEQESGTAPQ